MLVQRVQVVVNRCLQFMDIKNQLLERFQQREVMLHLWAGVCCHLESLVSHDIFRRTPVDKCIDLAPQIRVVDLCESFLVRVCMLKCFHESSNLHLRVEVIVNDWLDYVPLEGVVLDVSKFLRKTINIVKDILENMVPLELGWDREVFGD